VSEKRAAREHDESRQGRLAQKGRNKGAVVQETELGEKQSEHVCAILFSNYLAQLSFASGLTNEV
jgi:hypothetical protein